MSKIKGIYAASMSVINDDLTLSANCTLSLGAFTLTVLGDVIIEGKLEASAGSDIYLGNGKTFDCRSTSPVYSALDRLFTEIPDLIKEIDTDATAAEITAQVSEVLTSIYSDIDHYAPAEDITKGIAQLTEAITGRIIDAIDFKNGAFDGEVIDNQIKKQQQ